MIAPDRYKRIVDLINNAQDRGSDVVGYFSSMLDTLDDSEIVAGSTDRLRLEDQIEVTSEVMEGHHQQYARTMSDFVFVLQKYVTDTYGSVNDFLSDNNIQVLPVFADISEVVGFPIDAGNIENIS